MIGVLMSATLPARLGEPSRALIVARRLGRMRDRFPVVLGTLVSQTLLNILALVRARRGHVRHRRHLPRARGRARDRHDRAGACCSRWWSSTPWLLRRGKPSRFQRVQQAAAVARGAMLQVRSGLAGLPAARSSAPGPPLDAAHRVGDPVARLLRAAGGARARRARRASAPPPPCCSRSTSPPRCRPRRRTSASSRPPAWRCCRAYGVGKTDALAYGIILQAVEIATARGDGHARAGARGHDLEGPARCGPCTRRRCSCAALARSATSGLEAAESPRRRLQAAVRAPRANLHTFVSRFGSI